MVTDLITRLRNRAYRLATRDMNGDGAALALEAAKRIEALERRLSVMTDLARSHAAKAGPMHAWWDYIFDAEQILKEKDIATQ